MTKNAEVWKDTEKEDVIMTPDILVAGQGRRRKTIQHEGWIVRFFDGFAARNRMSPDLDVVLGHTRLGFCPTPWVRKNEIWVDARFFPEWRFLVKRHHAERQESGPYNNTRAELKRTMLLPTATRPDPVLRRITQEGIDVCFVDGAIVRQYYDPAFIFGGNWMVYSSYIPQRALWIDARLDPREYAAIILHEAIEAIHMEGGMSYDQAHRHATVAEIVFRTRHYGAIYPGDAHEHDRPKPRMFLTDPFSLLQTMRPHTQSRSGWCGPAALKTALSHFGHTVSEETLANACNTTEEKGTDHADLIGGAVRHGAAVFEKDRGSLEELAWFVQVARLPVIVGWWSAYTPPAGDHFSVVYHVTAQYVWLHDPEGPSRRIERRHFEKIWHDYDTPANVHYERWFMVPFFEHGSVFPFRGTYHHLPT